MLQCIRNCYVFQFAFYLLDVHSTSGLRRARSVSLVVLFGVPQGSVLGQILFFLYVADLLQLVKRYGLHPHCSADDTQIYLFSDPPDVDTLQERLSVCVDDVFSWITGCSLILARPRCSGVHPFDVSIRSRLVLLVLVTHLCFRYEQFETLGSTLTQMSPRVLTSLQSSKHVLLDSVKYAVCVVR